MYLDTAITSPPCFEWMIYYMNCNNLSRNNNQPCHHRPSVMWFMIFVHWSLVYTDTKHVDNMRYGLINYIVTGECNMNSSNAFNNCVLSRQWDIFMAVFGPNQAYCTWSKWCSACFYRFCIKFLYSSYLFVFYCRYYYYYNNCYNL